MLEVRNLSVTFPDKHGDVEALNDLNFSLASQEFLCVLGASGSGKSTLLRVLAGLVKPTRGEVVFTNNGHGASQAPRVGLVFQQANLMPWRNVIANITLPLEIQGVTPSEARPQAQEIIELIGLQGFEKAHPADLSGGMAQRVALGRALIQKPDLLLLDEPFGALDALTREHLGSELLRIWQKHCYTVVMVTHSISEALYLADRVLVFTPRPGKVRLEMKIDLPRPRQEEMRYTAHFGEMSRQLHAAIGEQKGR